MDLKKTISNTYFNLMNKPIDGKQLQYWEQAINNNAATIDTFIHFIVEHNAYVDVAFQTFQLVFNNLLPEYKGVANIKELFDVFWKSNKGQEIKPELCRGYICKLPFFENYINNVINDIYNFEFNRDAQPDEIAFYTNKIVVTSGNTDFYSVQDLMKDISSKANISSSKTVPDTTTTNGTSIAKKYDEESVDRFEDVFNRPIYVQEYFKYVVENDTDGQTLEELLVSHLFQYNKLRNIFQNYTGKAISEYYFVKKYLYKVNRPEFYDNIVDEIVGSVEYKHGMQKILCDKYKKLYDQALYETDIDYIFKIVKSKKMNIVTEELEIVLEQLKEETDEIVANIFKVYMDVLQRAPDMMEIEKYTEFYRDRKDTHAASSTNTELEKILVSTLEFHDIIKKHIKSVYASTKEKDVLQSTMYDILNKIIARIDEVSMKSLDTVIQSLL